MTTHVRQQIREAVATALTGLTTTGARVFQSRVRPLADADLPCLLVMTDGEEIERIGIDSAAILSRSLTATIRAVVKATSSLDDTLDNCIKEIETALGGAAIAGLSKPVALIEIRIELDDSTDKPVGYAELRYRIPYFTAASAPTTAL